jgi:Fur family peroxide stress response transcriptional regulator
MADTQTTMPSDDESLIAACRAHGMKATPQRIAILRALRQSHGHPGPEHVYATVKNELPSVSLATVYKTLDTLEQHGVIEEVTLRADSKRYDANLAPHHHVVCMRCKAIEDIDDDEAARAMPKVPAGFQVRFSRLQILGVCAKCQSNEAREGRAPSEPTS